MASKEIADVSITHKEASLADSSPTSPSRSVEDISPAPGTPLPPADLEKADSKPKPPPYTAFTPARQTFILLIATAAGFFSPLTGAVYLPSLILFEQVFNTTSSVINATITLYMAVFAVAPLFGAAASDYGGRKTVYVVTLAIFLVANAILAAVPPNLGALFVLRVFQALGSSMVTAVGAGTVADITEPAKRASRMGIFLLGPQLGPLLGPLIGGQFSTMSRWRWIFGFLCIACTPVYLLVLFYLPETLRCLVGNGSIYAGKRWIVRPRLVQKQVVEDGKFPKPPRPTVKGLLKTLTFVPNAIVSIASALSFSGLYCIYVQFPKVWQTQYGWTGAETGYGYLAPGIALLLGSLIIGRISDMQYRNYKAKHDGQAPAPEGRLNIQVYGYISAAAGKLMFGWFAYKHYHPSAGLVASAIAAVGTGISMVSSTAYQTECQPSAAALLVALSGMLRNVGSAISAAIIGVLVEKMGLGWCMTGLAFLDALCIAGLLFIRVRGHVYRERLSAGVQATARPAAPR